MSHMMIEREAVAVVAKKRPPRNAVKDPAPWIDPALLVGIAENGAVSGYERGVAHEGTFYRECEGVTRYPDEPFLRVVMFGDETHDLETRIPLSMLAKAGFRQIEP